jgi:hypothetical protein
MVSDGDESRELRNSVQFYLEVVTGNKQRYAPISLRPPLLNLLDVVHRSPAIAHILGPSSLLTSSAA